MVNIAKLELKLICKKMLKETGNIFGTYFEAFIFMFFLSFSELLDKSKRYLEIFHVLLLKKLKGLYKTKVTHEDVDMWIG